jgi:hypothetical protein
VSFADYLEAKLLDHILSDPAYAPPASLYVALSTTTPADDGTGFTEPGTGGYARAVTVAADWSAAAGGQKTNSAAIIFTTPSGAWGTITHFAIYDAAAAGNMLLWGALTSSRTVVGGVAPKFSAGALIIAMD